MRYEVEYLDTEALQALQLERLRRIAARAYGNVAHYQKVFDEVGMAPQDLKSLADLRRLPLTDKETLRLNYPFGMFAVPMKEVKEIHASSGTTGKPTVVAY
ncbi:MAG: phenylacetate--CoA ligase, partial [Gemmatimonadota bacterium]